MPFTLDTFEIELGKALKTFDKTKAAELVDEFIQDLYASQEAIPTSKLENILQMLRSKRMFALMQRLCDCYIQMGLQSLRIRRQYAQSLVEQGIYAGALCILQQLKLVPPPEGDPASATEPVEITALIGRIYKQQYVSAAKLKHPRTAELLKLSIQYYEDAYLMDTRKNLFPGINLVALLYKAEKDNIGFKRLPGPNIIANDILKQINNNEAAGMGNKWDYATACEACIALSRPEEALNWLERYIATNNNDEFAVSSSLRQLKEIWGLDMEHPVGKELLPVLNTALLQMQGATVTITREEATKQQSAPDTPNAPRLERVLGNTGFRTLTWYSTGLQVCSSVARIASPMDDGFGTGFLLNGEELSETLKGQIVLLTNAHVISDQRVSHRYALRYDQAVATLETVDRQLKLKFKGILFTSPVGKLDTTVLAFDDDSHQKLLDHRDSIHSLAIAPAIPIPDQQQRVYIIGHPRGGNLQFSLQDNLLLARKEQLMHYRAPTEGGSSGSPVFNENWELIGIHHGGGDQMLSLDEPTRIYAANEGIIFPAIKAGFNGAARSPGPDRVIFP